MKVYIIEANGGQHDDAWNSICSVFSSKQKAQTEVDRLEAEQKMWTNRFHELNKEYHKKEEWDSELHDKCRKARQASSDPIYYNINEFELDQLENI